MKMLYQIYIDDVYYNEDNGMVTGVCDALGLVSSGKDKKEAENNLRNSVIAYCRALDKRGVLTERLKQKKVEYRINQIDEPEHNKQRKLIPVLVG